MLFTACKKSDIPAIENSGDQMPEVAVTSRHCAAYEVLAEQLKADPTLQERMDAIESFTKRYEEGGIQMHTIQPDGSMLIPVVVNVLYRTAAENISDAQIQSQIDILNEDFGATNAVYFLTSTYNSVKLGDIKIKYVLDQVIRKSTTKTSWSTNDAMKKGNKGGINTTSPTLKLNLWLCNLSSGILGYAQFPVASASTDGVVCDNNAFGRVGTATAPFYKGRTATHEVGHWLNLRHIWGDALCGSDMVGDTPTHNDANFGCPGAVHLSTCSGTPVEMTMNYMDYTDDACMYMFSAGQKTRMQATYAVGGPRASFC